MMPFSSRMNESLPTIARAIVRAVDDPEKHGRIRVEYPWYNGTSSQLPSEWARVCLPYASNGSGMWMIPEVGDEVVVFFEHGDLEFPIVLGSLYSSRQLPPKSERSADGTKDIRFLKTRSGHVLCFDDSEEGGILVKDRDGRKLEIDSKGKKVVLSDAKANRISIEEKGITVETAGGAKLKMQEDKISIDAGGTIELGEGAAMSVVLGQSFQTLFNSHVHGTAWGPSSPPMAPMTPDMISRKVKVL